MCARLHHLPAAQFRSFTEAMNERLRAIEILRQARDLLVRQLSERIVDAEEGVLDDATGQTFGGEIESLYEGLGIKLTNVTAMLAALRSHADEHVFAAGNDLAQVATSAQQSAYVQTDTNEVVRSTPQGSSFDTTAPTVHGDSHEEGGESDG